jgi:hypothetical protein
MPCAWYFPYYEIVYRNLKNRCSAVKIVKVFSGIVFSPPNVQGTKVGWGATIKET